MFLRNSSQTPKVVEAAHTFVETQLQVNDCGCSKAQSSGTKRPSDKKPENISGTTLSKIIRFELDISDENEWDLPDELARHVNRYMATQTSKNKG